ncbi:sensor histidine kinase, partial [uncultured Thalassolituus sp.]|uniref:sensor histidine kinase n=1 Tax=uncultured Thalassolituus sp. TaxID=285273 RepID=UPI00260B7FB3
WTSIRQKNKKLINSLNQLESTTDKLVQSEKMASLGILSAGIAHEINNPLAYIDSNLNGLVDDLEALNEFIRLLDNASDHLDIRNPFYQQTLSGYQDLNIAIVCENAPVRVRDCINGVQRIEQIINDMRTLSHGGSEGQSLTDINADLPAVFHIIESRLSDDISFETRLTEVPLTRCNPSQIAQVVMNILVNAVHALEEKATPGSLGVYQRIVGDQLLMEIVDTGTGMAPEVQSRIFEPFYTTREKGKGTGIGLALCYKLIREHDGEIRVSSRPGAGTTFSLTIPLRTGDSDNAQ